MQFEELERKIGEIVLSLAPVGPLTAELIPLVGDETSLPHCSGVTEKEGPWDVALDVCLPLARILNRSADELALELGARLEKELALIVYPLRGYVNIRLPDACLWGEPAPRECILSSANPPSMSVSEGVHAGEGNKEESHLVVVPAPWRGASGMQYLRFVMAPLMQAVMLSQRELSPRAGEVILTCGTKEFPISSGTDVPRIVEYLLERAAALAPREEDLSISEQISRASLRPSANVWWWAWEDFRENDDLFSFLRSSPLSALRQSEPGRFAAGCPKQLLTHLPVDERVAELDLTSANRICSFMLYAVSGVPGPEFVPSACGLPRSEWPDPAQFLWWAESVLARYPFPRRPGLSDSLLKEPPLPRVESRECGALEREALLGAKILPRLASRAGRRAQVLAFGRALEQLLEKTQRLLNTPDFHAALSGGDAHALHVFSSIYRNVQGVLTVVHSACQEGS